MHHVILVKHSLPQIAAAVPPNRWHLAPEGRRRCTPLAQRLGVFQPTVIASSGEPKAAETAALLAEHLGIPFEVGDGLHEHERDQTPFLAAEHFERAIARFFRHPTAAVGAPFFRGALTAGFQVDRDR